MRIVHCADIHLDSPLKGLRHLPGMAHEEVRLATRRAFVRLIDLCLDQQAELLLIAGDLFDKDQKDYQAGLFAARQFARLQETKTAVVLVRGNHDSGNITKTLKESKNLDVFVLSHSRPESQDFDTHGVVVHGYSFPEMHVRDNLIHKLPPPRKDFFNIGLLHADVGGSADGEYAYCPCSKFDLLDKGYDYWALGHNHTRQQISDAPYVMYPGNLQGRHMQETGEKGCTLIEVNDGQIESVTFKSCDTVRWEHARVDVSDCQSVDSVLSAAHDALGTLRRACYPEDHPLVVRVTLFGEAEVHSRLYEDTADVREQIRGMAADWMIWPERVDIVTTPLQCPAAAMPSGFLSALDKEFARLGEDPSALQALLTELIPLEQMTSVFQLDIKPTDPIHAKKLLQAAAHTVAARLSNHRAATT